MHYCKLKIKTSSFERFKYDISLVNGDTYGDDPNYADQPDEVKRQEVRYGLMGMSLAEFLSLEVPEEAFKTATAGQLLAYAFWDLSFFGFMPGVRGQSGRDIRNV